VSIIVIALFFGGYHFVLVDQVPILGPIVFFVKIVLFLSGMIWVRATLPRIRYDRLMSFGWKIMLPLALLGVGWTAVSVILGDTFQSPVIYGIASVMFFVIVAIAALVAFRPQETTPMGEDATAIDLQPRGIGYVLMQVAGSLLSVPFVIFRVTQGLLANLQTGLRPENK